MEKLPYYKFMMLYYEVLRCMKSKILPAHQKATGKTSDEWFPSFGAGFRSPRKRERNPRSVIRQDATRLRVELHK